MNSMGPKKRVVLLERRGKPFGHRIRIVGSGVTVKKLAFLGLGVLKMPLVGIL